jgi:hypothetical protein
MVDDEAAIDSVGRTKVVVVLESNRNPSAGVDAESDHGGNIPLNRGGINEETEKDTRDEYRSNVHMVYSFRRIRTTGGHNLLLPAAGNWNIGTRSGIMMLKEL